MMKEDIQWLREKILEFMITIEDCLISTTYTEDRSLYASDLATAARWLIKLHKKEPLINICLEIVSPNTSKYFGDYWKQGSWGDNEMKSLDILQEQIKSKFNVR
jgi:hypothetical protein